MRKFLSERNFVVILFVVAFVVFYFAQEDAKKIEKMYMNTNASSEPFLAPATQTAGNNVPVDKAAKSIGIE